MITLSLREGFSLLVFMLVFLAVYGLEGLLVVGYLIDRIRGQPRKRGRPAKPIIVLHVVAGIGIVCMLYGHFIEPNWIDVHTTTLRTPKLKTAGFRVVQISDLHCDWKIRNEEKMVQIVSALKPDIVVATGDYVNHPMGLSHLRDALRRLEAPLGKFAVTGNLDGRYPADFNLLEGTGLRLLRRETVVVTKGEESIGVMGVDFARSEFPLPAVEPLPDDRFDILLFHTPDLVEDVRGWGIDLYLCGHTHGGQVRLPLYGALVTFSKFGKKYESGLYRVGATMLYVNRGLGLEPRPGPQVRFLARPEIAVFDIVPEQP